MSIASEGNLNSVVSQAQTAAREIQSALNGASIGGSGGGTGTSTDFFAGLRTTVQLTRGELESFYGTTATTFNKVMGEDIPHAAQMSTGDLQSFYSTVTGMNTELPSTNNHLEMLNRMFALQNLQTAFENLKGFGEALASFLGEGVQQAMSFQESQVDIASALAINKDASVNWKSGAESASQLNDRLKSLGATALQIALDTKFNDTEMNQMIAFLTQNGVAYQDVVGGVARESAMLAQATNSEWQPAAKAMTNIWHSMGDTLTSEFGGNVNAAMTKVADTLTNITNTSGANLDTIGSTMKYVGPVANALGISFDELGVAVDVLYRAGIQGSQAGTSLRRMFTNLTPVSDKAAETMRQLGIITADGTNRFYDQNGKVKSLAEIQSVLYDSMKDLNDEQKTFALRTIFGQYALQSMEVLVGTTPAKFKDLADKIKETGTAEEKSSAWRNTDAASWDVFIENVTAAKRTMGSFILEGIGPLLERGSDLISWFTNLPEPVLNVISKVAAVVAGLAILVGTVGSAVTGFALLNAGLAAAGTSFGAIAMTALPIVGVIAAIVAAVVLLYEAWTNDWGHIREVTAAVWDYIGPTIISAMTTVRDTVVSAVQAVIEWWDKIAPDVQKVIDFIVKAIAYFSPVWKATWEAISAVVKGAWDAITSFIRGAWEVVSGIFDFFIHLVTGNWSALWGDLKRIFDGFKTMFVGVFRGVWEAVSGVFVAFWHGLTGMFSKMWDGITTWFNGWSGPFKSTVGAVWDAIKVAAKLAWDIMTGDWSGALDSVEQATGVKKGTILVKVGEVIDGIKEFFRKLPGEMYQFAVNAVQMFIDGIHSMLSKVGQAASNLAGEVKSFLGFHSPTEEGPASDSDRWAPNFVNMLADTMTNARPALQRALSGLAMDMSVGVNGGMTTAASTFVGVGGRGQTIVQATFVYQGSGGTSDFNRFADAVVRKIGAVNA